MATRAARELKQGSRNKCSFCNLSKEDPVSLGKRYKLGNVTAHYYCVLLCSDLPQAGRNDEGIFGFLLKDIRLHLKKIRKVFCSYCRKNGASIFCQAKSCSVRFHLPCGIRNSSLSTFTKYFSSFCSEHRYKQRIPPTVLKKSMKNACLCPVCIEAVNPLDRIASIRGSCCGGWYHRHCISSHALSAASLLKCSLCNNKSKFIAELKRCGIFIPYRDASWELENNAYQDLLHRHNQCDSKTCLSPLGRSVNEVGTMWQLIICRTCGSEGMHIFCGGLPSNTKEGECGSCYNISKKSGSFPKNLKPIECIVIE